MRFGKMAFRIVVLLAVLSGVVACLLLRQEQDLITMYQSVFIYSGDQPGENNHDKQMRRRYPDQPSLLLHQDADFYLNLYKSHPDRPWYLWRWWLTHQRSRHFPRLDKSGLVLSRQEAVTRQKAAEFADETRFLRESDPDNGYPLLFEAWLEVKEGVALVQADSAQPFRPTVVNPEHAARSAELLREAIGRKRFTMYGKEAGAEWLRILGQPRTYVESWTAIEQLGGLPLPNLIISRDLAQRLVGEAKRRAEEEREGRSASGSELTAYDILHDLQTLGALIALGEPELITVMTGYSIMNIASEEGAEALNDAGRPEDAKRLRTRGRELTRPRLLAFLMQRPDIDTLRPGAEDLLVMEDDPALIEEAKRLVALRRQNERQGSGIRSGIDGDMNRAGPLTSISIPSISTTIPWTTPLITLDDLKTSAHFELWGWHKLLTLFLFVATWSAFLVLLLLNILHSRANRDDAPDRWPPPRQTAVAGLLFGVLAVGPGLAVTFAGNFLWEISERYNIWHIFWNVWGLLAACWALGLLIRKQSNRKTTTGFDRIIPWIALAGLLAAIPYAYLAYSGIVTPWSSVTAITRNEAVWWYAKATLPLVILLAPVPIWGVNAFLRGRRASGRHSSAGAASTPGLRLFLAGLAGGLVVWLGSYYIVDRQDRAWTARDTLLVPRASAISFTPIEARLVDVHTRNIERVLAAESATQK